MSIIERSDGRWGSVITIIPTAGFRQPKYTVKQWFVDRLVENLDCHILQEDLIKAVAEGELTQKDVDEVIEKALKERAILMYRNISNLLAGSTSKVLYNFGTGLYEPQPPLGWGQ